MRKIIKLLTTITVMFISGAYIYGQGMQTSLFNDVDKIMLAATESQADVLSPKAYEEGMEAYKKAKDAYKDDGEISEIKQNITQAGGKFTEAIDNSKVSAVMFANSLSARKDAINAEAGSFSKDSWMEAEETMKDAAEELEKGDADDAKEKASTASELYRKAELESIKANYLTKAKKLLEHADDNKVDKRAPKTFNEAKGLINQAEKELVENRYDTDEARYLAKQAEYKASLAMNIAQQEEILDDRDFEAEDYILMVYEPLNTIGENLNLDLKFDKGIQGPVSEILTKTNKDAFRISSLEAELYNSKMANQNMTEMLAEQQKIQENMEGQLSEDAVQAQKRQQVLQARIDRIADIDSKFDKIQQIFNAEEALVFRQKDNIIIRMVGVNFDIGKAEIKQEDYALLAKLEKAIGTFDNASVVIEGHTDSQGADDNNLELSEQRAAAVLSYLSANINIDKSRFSTTGYGESKPVANNETKLGRTQNRRIDVIIIPTIGDTTLSLGSND
ncbi:OmpA family protein [Fulvivirga maritima]|uniref:OmpA family protein n=1 Tax=Fulvivirga maritima TaxID=2904247 RepID=UPI001F368EC7|nr:OmpA family protein [Fulvivirga maritima]UII27608.1 OmpA family protein [Fulvivirga maritima]